MFFNAGRKADLALERLDSHEDLCTERYEALNKTIIEIKTTIKENHQEDQGARRAQYVTAWTLVGGVITALLSFSAWSLHSMLVWK
jgi:hypothetical protein